MLQIWITESKATVSKLGTHLKAKQLGIIDYVFVGFAVGLLLCFKK